MLCLRVLADFNGAHLVVKFCIKHPGGLAIINLFYFFKGCIFFVFSILYASKAYKPDQPKLTRWASLTLLKEENYPQFKDHLQQI